MADIQTCPRLYACPAYLQVWSYDQNLRHYMARTRSNMGFFSTQGQIWIVQYGQYSNLSKILCLSWISASLKILQSKLKVLCPGQGRIWAFSALKASNFKMNCTIWPIFKLVQDFMPVLNTCKFEEKLQSELKAVCPRSNTGFFNTQGQVTLRRILQYHRNSNLSEILSLS